MLTSRLAWRCVLFCAVISSASALPMLPSIAQSKITEGQRLAANCANCHGSDGVAVDGKLPALAGQSKEDLLGALQAYKNGNRTGTVMPQIAKGYSEQQLAALAEHFAAQKK